MTNTPPADGKETPSAPLVWHVGKSTFRSQEEADAYVVYIGAKRRAALAGIAATFEVGK